MNTYRTTTSWQIKPVRWLTALLSIILFAVITFGVVNQTSWIATFDQAFIGLIRSDQLSKIRPVVLWITQSGNPMPVGLFTLIVAIMLILFKNYRFTAFLLLNVLLLGGIINSIIKNIVQRPRPNNHPLLHLNTYSFPSGHSITAMLLFGSLIILTFHLIRQQTIRIIVMLLFVIWLLLIGLSRIYVGVHYPSDVLAGFLLGYFFLTASQALFYGVKWR